MPKKFIEAGKIVGTHGVRGEMRVQPWCDSADFLTEFKKIYLDADGKNYFTVTLLRAHGNICLLKAKGVETIEEAERYRGRVIYIDRDDCSLQAGQYFVTDIIGCSVFDFESGNLLGHVSDVSETGANDVWHIKSNGNEYYIPNIPEIVKYVDIENGKIIIAPLKGMFDDEN